MAKSSPYSSSSSTSDVSGDTVDLEDVEYLLNLEALKRMNEDDQNIRRQVEEQARQLHDIKQEYLTFYDKYTTLLKLVGTRNALLTKPQLDDTLVADGIKHTANISQKVTSDRCTVYLDEKVLNPCKVNLTAHTTHEDLSKQKAQLAVNRETAKSVQLSTENVEATLEAATVQGLQQLILDIQLENVSQKQNVKED